MKQFLILSIFIFVSTGFASTSHNDNVERFNKRDILFAINKETQACAIKVVANRGDHKETLHYKSICNTLNIISDQEAQIYVLTHWYTCKITESPDSDGGDLDDLTVYNNKGRPVAMRKNMIAFDYVLNAMAGGEGNLQEEEEHH